MVWDIEYSEWFRDFFKGGELNAFGRLNYLE
jgi:hypothetical protein